MRQQFTIMYCELKRERYGKPFFKELPNINLGFRVNPVRFVYCTPLTLFFDQLSTHNTIIRAPFEEVLLIP